jgi:hypothetical protein
MASNLATMISTHNTMQLRLKQLALAAVLQCLSLHGYALSEVPAGLPPAVTAALQRQHLKVMKQREALNLRISKFETTCINVVVGSRKERECEVEQGTIKIEKMHYKTQSDAYELERTVAIDNEVKSISNRLAKTKKRLEELTGTLLGFQDSVDEWVNLANDARDKARHTALETTAKVLLEGLKTGKEAEVKLDEKALKRINLIMRKRVFMDDLFAKVVTTERLASLKTDLDTIKLLKDVQHGLILGTAMTSKDREEVMKGVLAGIELVNHDPRIALLIADGEITIDAAYGWLAHKLASDRINQLVSLGNARFNEVKGLTSFYKEDVDKRKALLAARTK